MALSRFWTFILLLSIGYVLIMLGTGRQYSLGSLINGVQGEALVVAEQDSATIHGTALLQAIRSAGDDGLVRGDTLYHINKSGVVQASVGKQQADGLFATCRNTIMDLWLPLIGYLTFFCGLLNLLIDSNAMEKVARFLSPVFHRVFPELRKDHPAYGFMTLNFAANFLGLDSAATPFGLKAMESMQEDNKDKDTATNSQIMFLCLHAAGLTLLPTSIIGYRAAQGAANPADIMIPMIITSFAGTLAAMFLVAGKQRINLWNVPVMATVLGISAIVGGAMAYIGSLAGVAKFHFTDNLSNGMLLVIIGLIVAYAFYKEKFFTAKGTNMFDSFVEGAKEGWTTGLRVLPYMLAMLAALSIFRNSGLMGIVMDGLTYLMAKVGVEKGVIDAIPVALMRPFSAGGSRGFMLDAMKTYGPDSITGYLSSLFQGAAETTFYVVALYYGSVNVKNTRYTIGIMLLADLVCVIAGIVVVHFYF
ncbi:MAG: spore maturation protein [Flavobacteriales bacterium]|nr:spore maturation protein [Flavobacteriales bacterium]MBK6945462.1 spore maturation protein [Flavobacteriales bacterium]MBK7241575.1 spore maturation protein [Flavobacteriales bacterium]MBK9534984.1 spore maturation protein [Flavobacteriales bacterium]MBP9138447.1 spore maturation protein [Flavobacteriales bacterium]